MIRIIFSAAILLLCCLLSACTLDSTPIAGSDAVQAPETKPTQDIPTPRNTARSAENNPPECLTAEISPAVEPTSSHPTEDPLQTTPAGDDSTCVDVSGRLESGSLESDLMSNSLDFQVYLPPSYDRDSNQTYPTLYLLHGQGYTESQWDQLGAVETSDEMIASNEVSPYIIVMPHELMGVNSKRSNFDRVLAEELIPFIDKKYRTIPEREFRAVGGLSRGAGWAVELGINHWELFGAFGAHSPAILNTNPVSMGSLLDAIPLDKYPRIFIDTGDREPPSIVESAIWLGDLLNQKGIPHEWYRFSGVHDGSYWREHLEGYLRWYTGSW